MKIEEKEKRFEEWYSKNELRFHHAQMSDKDIAYSAFMEGQSLLEEQKRNHLKALKNTHLLMMQFDEQRAYEYLTNYLQDLNRKEDEH